MQSSLVTALPRGPQRVLKWRFSTFTSHKNTEPTESGTPLSFRHKFIDISIASSVKLRFSLVDSDIEYRNIEKGGV